jgi:hypothetical protein
MLEDELQGAVRPAGQVQSWGSGGVIGFVGAVG